MDDRHWDKFPVYRNSGRSIWHPYSVLKTWTKTEGKGKSQHQQKTSIKECPTKQRLSIRENVICLNNKENIRSIFLHYFPKHLHLQDLIHLASLPDVSYTFCSRDGWEQAERISLLRAACMGMIVFPLACLGGNLSFTGLGTKAIQITDCCSSAQFSIWQ